MAGMFRNRLRTQEALNFYDSYCNRIQNAPTLDAEDRLKDQAAFEAQNNRNKYFNSGQSRNNQHDIDIANDYAFLANRGIWN